MPGAAKAPINPCARVRRAAHDLHRLAVAGIDRQHLQLVGIRVFLGRQHPGDGERLELRLVVNRFNLEADAGQALDDLVERGVGFPDGLSTRRA